MPFQKVGDTKVHYHVSGEGEPLLLVAGLFGDLHNWKKTVPLFEKNYQVIVCDNRGSGLTEAPADSFTMRDLADDAAGLLGRVGNCQSPHSGLVDGRQCGAGNRHQPP